MARVFITGSADGLGRRRRNAARGRARDRGPRSQQRPAHRRARTRGRLCCGGRRRDLFDFEQTRGVADQVNRLGPMDAVIHNAGVISGPHVLPVNVVAPYLLTALDRPRRLIYLSSSMHRGGRATLGGLGLGRSPHDGLLLGQQALGHHARRRRRPALARRVQQRGGPWLGAHEDGRPRRPRRPAARAPHPGVARHQRGPRSANLGRLLASPDPRRPGTKRQRPAVPGSASRGPRLASPTRPSSDRRPDEATTSA